MKIKKLKRSITANGTGTIILLSFLLLLIFVLISSSAKKSEEIAKIKQSTIILKSQTSELNGKLNEAKKYKEIYKTIDDNRKTTKGIKMDEVTNNMNILAEKFDIDKPTLQAVVPEKIEGALATLKTLDILYTTGTLTFAAVDDLRAAAFIKEFFQAIPGYSVITDLSLVKTKTYDNQDLVAISNGQKIAAIGVKISFVWYVYKNKDKPVTAVPAAVPAK